MNAAPRIRYSQGWEDPETLLDGLRLTPEDSVLSIAAAGDNTFALLLRDVRRVVALDRNPAQLHLVELKVAAIDLLDHAAFLDFIGVLPSRTRLSTYERLRGRLSRDARDFWDLRPADIRRGIVHAGTFERYFRLFRRAVLPLIHSRETVRELFLPRPLPERERFYRERWNTVLWRGLFRLFYSRRVLGGVGRGPATFAQVEASDVAGELLRRAERAFTVLPPAVNYFLRYILTGEYPDPEAAHPYLRRASFDMLKQRTSRLSLVCADLEPYLASMPPGAFTAFNLSDVFEYMPAAAAARTIGALIRVAGRGARIGFWTLFVPPPLPAAQGVLQPEADDTGFRRSRTFFYSGFHVWRVAGGNALTAAA